MNDLKKVTQLILSGALVIGIFPFTGNTSQAAVTSFKDVPKSHWAKASIDAAVAKGYFKGYSDGTFKPGATVTRAEFAALLARVAKGTPETEQDNVFKDLTGHWSQKEVDRAVSLGFINVKDYPNGFKPSTIITREEMAKWISSGLAAADKDFEQALEDTKTSLIPVKEAFSPGISPSKAPYIAVAIGTGVMTGYPDKSFGLTKTTTRAEASVILLRIANMEGKKASSFEALNEIRSVGVAKSNFKEITPFEFTTGRDFSDASEKKVTFSNKSGSLVLHRTIAVDASDWNNKKGVYAPFFFSESYKEWYQSYPKKLIAVFQEVTIYPNKKGFNLDDYRQGLSNSFFGSALKEDLAEKFGYTTLPKSNAENFFAKYSSTNGVRIWIVKWYDEGYKGLVAGFKTDDGSGVQIYGR
ncbi:S-layer homology domain-containing protein [Paenibacillus sp. FSL M8-0212]|uniref:S-layer homology domain-containing protein n=1 Tax=Paenibacillus sp. FSL M8-0212 TaxID=2921618 RepID=UPI004046AD8D